MVQLDEDGKEKVLNIQPDLMPSFDWYERVMQLGEENQEVYEGPHDVHPEEEEVHIAQLLVAGQQGHLKKKQNK